MKLGLVGTLVVSASCTSAVRQQRLAAARSIDLERAVAEQKPIEERAIGPVVLVTVDGARWQEVFLGSDARRVHGKLRPPRDVLPNLYRLATERGALIGAPGHGTIRATGPNFVSLPGYTEILTGRTAVRCQDNDCAPATAPTVLDEAYAAGASVAAFASWDRLSRAITVAPGRFPVSCGRDSAKADPFPGHGDYRPDALTAELALAYFERSQPDVLFLGLGDPDEYAHRDDYDAYVRSLQYADAVVGRLFAALGRMGDRGANTHVFVTADHGRAATFRDHGGWAPESARVWLFAAGPTISARGRARLTDDRRLADIAPTIRVLLGLANDGGATAGNPLAELFGEHPAANLAARIAATGLERQ